MKKLLFSVIVPVYNVESYLEKCVRSLLKQEEAAGAWEILLIDDGSTDRSGALCDRIAAAEPQVKAFHKKNGGLSSARNYGLERAEGEYVLFVDSDDYVEADMLCRLSEALRKYGGADALCYNGVENDGEESSSVRRVPAERIRCTKEGKQYLLEHYRTRNLSVEAWLYAYRSGFLKEHGLRFREGRLHEDVEFTPRALLACGKIVELPDALYHYVVRDSSISTQKNKERNIRDLFATLREQAELAERQEPELRKWMNNAIVDHYLNMVQYARMDRPQYRGLVDRRFLKGKAATGYNRLRVLLCTVSVRLYCAVNGGYKRIKG